MGSYVDDISLSLSASSGAQSGDIAGGDFIVGGSGGASKSQIPTIAWIIAGAVAVIALFAFLMRKK